MRGPRPPHVGRRPPLRAARGRPLLAAGPARARPGPRTAAAHPGQALQDAEAGQGDQAGQARQERQAAAPQARARRGRLARARRPGPGPGGGDGRLHGDRLLGPRGRRRAPSCTSSPGCWPRSASTTCASAAARSPMPDLPRSPVDVGCWRDDPSDRGNGLSYARSGRPRWATRTLSTTRVENPHTGQMANSLPASAPEPRTDWVDVGVSPVPEQVGAGLLMPVAAACT